MSICTISPLTTLIPDILKILISYIHSYELTKIFASYNLNFNMDFIYNASTFNFDNHTFHLVFNLFSNPTLKSIRIMHDGFQSLPQIVPQKTTNIEIISTKTNQSFYFSTLRMYTNLTKLYIQDFKIICDYKIINHNNISKIKLNSCLSHTSFSFLQNLPNLRTFKFSGILTNGVLHVLSKCNALKTIIFDDIEFSYGFNPTLVTLKTIMKIKITLNYSDKIILLMQVMPNLKHISIINYNDKYHNAIIQTISACTKLTNLTFICRDCSKYASNIIILPPTFCPKTLKSIKFVNCSADVSTLDPSIVIRYVHK